MSVQDPSEERCVIIGRFPDPHSAHLARGFLESEGIEAFVHDEHTVSIHWLYSNAIGGVRLEVKESDAARASELLEQDRSWEAEIAASEAGDQLPGVRCPRCGSESVNSNERERRAAWALMGLLGLPHLGRGKRWTCEPCGHTWR